MKIVRFRGRFVAAAVISLLCTIAVLRTLLIHDSGEFAVDSLAASDNKGRARHSKDDKEKVRKVEESGRKLPFDADSAGEKRNRKPLYFKKITKSPGLKAKDIQGQLPDQQQEQPTKIDLTNDISLDNKNRKSENEANKIDDRIAGGDNVDGNNAMVSSADKQDADRAAKEPIPAQPDQQQQKIDQSQDKIVSNSEKEKLSALFQNNQNQQQQVQQQSSQNQQQEQPTTLDKDLALPPHLNGKYPVLYNGKFVPIRRIVHIDLKGAHPKLFYFEKFFELISKMGATGVLIEYEDTFPYTGPLAFARSGRAYSEKSIKTILGWAKKFNLEVIPLVQTFGHLEWVLKHDKYKSFREVDRYAQVICLSNFDAVQLVKTMIDQVMALHKNTGEFFHMGADEAFQIGMCDKCQNTIRTQLNNNRDRLMLRHIANISSYVREKYGKRVLMWHDMLNNVDTQTIKEYYVDKLVEPVVWAYAENLNDYLMPDMWTRFASTFPYIWGSSAYKGADGPSRFYSNVPHYLQNHVSWTGQMTREYRNFKEFRGIIMTGWQRFDHFAILCEILPVGIPSLAVNLLTLEFANYDRNILKRASKFLDCSGTLEIESQGVGAYCQFPGAKVYQLIQQFHSAQINMRTQLLDDVQLRGWLSDFNVRHNYSSAWYLDQISDKVNMYRNEFLSISRQLRTEMQKIFFSDAIDEFFYTYISPDVEKLNNLYKNAQEIAKIRTFPGRPFAIAGAETPKPGEPTTTESP